MKNFNLDILGQSWNVEISDDEYVYNDGKAIEGTAHFWYQTMKIANRHPDKQKTTLLHEIIHVVNEIQDSDLTEHQVALLEVGLYQAFKKNNIYKIWGDIDAAHKKGK